MSLWLKRKKTDKWALNKDLIFTIFFTLLCVCAFKAIVQGIWWGEALHIVGEPYNDTFTYISSEEDSDNFNRLSNTTSSIGFFVKEDELLFETELTKGKNLESKSLKRLNYSQGNSRNAFKVLDRDRNGLATVKNLKNNMESTKS